MIRKGFYALLFLILLACQSKTNFEKPKDLIPPDKMEDLLFDIYLAIGAGGVENLEGEKGLNYMGLVYEKYQIDSVQFAASNLYYTSKVNDYDEILKGVKKRLEDRRDQTRMKLDSITEINSDSITKSEVPMKQRGKKIPDTIAF